jgi:micrococcal nuclease
MAINNFSNKFRRFFHLDHIHINQYQFCWIYFIMKSKQNGRTLLIFRVILLGFTLITIITHGARPAAANSTIGSMNCLVTDIINGDNITVNAEGTQIKVQLYGVYAPVMTQINYTHNWLRKIGQPFARESFIALANKILHQQVNLEIMQIVSSPHSPYLRAIATVRLAGRNINLEMVAEGMGWASRTFPGQPYAAEYVHAQEHARAGKLGLWTQNNPVPPWEFKKTGNAKLEIIKDSKTP